MKRSEFLDKQLDFWSRVIRDGSDPGATAAELAARDVKAVEGAGFGWDPEEPELPKRLWAFGEGGGYLSASESGLHGASLEELTAAAAAYNRLQSGELVDTSVSTEAILKALAERDATLAELSETRLLLHHIAAAVGLSQRPHGTWSECSRLALDIRSVITAGQRPAGVISKTKGGRTIHYAVGPTRQTREEAEHDLREWFDKEAS